MKKFCFFIFKILLLVFTLSVLIDYIYSTCYLQTRQRGKIGFIFNSEPQKFDVIILGSSRANNHLVSKMFTDKGLRTFNFGMQGSKLFESDLVLKLLLERKCIIKNVIIDVDVTLKSERKSEANCLKFLPYFHRSQVIKKHFEGLKDYNAFCYIPFYRYLKYDTKIGFREAFFCSINKKSHELDYGGYNALPSLNQKLKVENLNFNPKPNRYYEEIKEICKINRINLIAIMTPVCDNVKGIDYFKKVNKLYPEIHNYENVVIEDKYFSSCGHMNDNGAKMFTAKILKDFFKK
ncbi:hypothetical protein BXU10_01355 [Flavobacterium sp. LM4]|nr:hypothetical protein BXU10_01355 [Flavobacterium sp. LM4]